MATPLIPPLPFGLLLKRHRRLRGMTQEQLAERAGFSVSYISMLERGDRAPTAPSGALLVEALDLDPAERAALDAALRRAMAGATDSTDMTARLPSTGQPDDDLALPVGGFLGARPEGSLVAREDELHVALAALDAALAGAGRLVTLVGEPGIGKTRLAQELAMRARARGALVATGRCDERLQSVGFAPIGEALGQIYAAAPAPRHAEFARRWPKALALLPDAVPDAVPNTPLDGARVGEEALAAGGAGERLRLLRQVSGLVEAVATRSPVALLLDDLHWADEASLDCLRHLARQTRAAPVFILATYRDLEVRRQPALRAFLLELVRDRLAERIALRPLARDATATLISTTLGAGEVEAQLGATIQDTTQGNPLFVQELARALAERGDVVLVDGRWQRRAAGSLAELELPESVLGAIGERVARLSPAAQAVLRAASVLGMAFAPDPLAAMSTQSAGEVEAALEEALAAGVIRETSGQDYGFSHALIQRAVYSEIPAPTRRRLHRAAGAALEQLRAGVRARHAAELADHFVRGDAPERALPYIIQAGDQAARVYAQAAALQHYTLAVGLACELGDAEREALARERRADVFYLLGRFEDGYADLLRATASYRAAGNWERLAWATCQMAKTCDALGRVAETMPFVEDLLHALAEDAQGRPQRGAAPRMSPEEATSLEALTARACAVLSARTTARLYLCLLSRLAFLGRYEAAIAFSAMAIARIRPAGEPGMVSLAYSFRALAQQAGGSLDDAAATLDEALRAAGSVGDLEAQFLALNTLAEIHERRAAPRLAQAAWQRALDALSQLGDTGRRADLLIELGRNALVLGEWAEARARWSEAVALCERNDRAQLWFAQGALVYLDRLEGIESVASGPGNAGQDGSARGAVSLAQDPTFALVPGARHAGPALYSVRMFMEDRILDGDPDALRDLHNHLGAEYADATLEPHDKSELAALLAWVELRLGHADEAARLLAQARARADARRNRAADVTIWRVEALLALHQGEWTQCEAALDRLLALCRAMPYPYAEAKALHIWGQLHQARGERAAARERYLAALTILTQLGETPYRAAVERALAALERPAPERVPTRVDEI